MVEEVVDQGELAAHVQVAGRFQQFEPVQDLVPCLCAVALLGSLDDAGQVGRCRTGHRRTDDKQREQAPPDAMPNA